MDPLSALSLASNVVQLVDAALNAFTVCHQIYKLGSSIEGSRIVYTSDQLFQCYSKLNESLKSDPATGSKTLQHVIMRD